MEVLIEIQQGKWLVGEITENAGNHNAYKSSLPNY